MCGIVGYVNLDGAPVDPFEKLIDVMCQSIHHRGPDQFGKRFLGPVAMGMTRLAIIDLKTGDQPIANEDESVWIVFNGEIYNFHSLRDWILERGHTLRTNTDTEVIVHLYEELGLDCLKKLEGMFAFAIWDSKKARLFIARDRMGEKPLHYGIFGKQLIFSSELKSILLHPAAKRELSSEGLQKYLAFEYVPAPLSIFKDIQKLLPGHFILFENGEITTHQYWRPNLNIVAGYDEAEAADRLMKLLTESIKLRMIADVPLGVFLSGGVDSSTIAALAAEISSKKIQTFSIGFSEESFDESSQAKLVSEHLGTDHYSALFHAQLARQTLEELWEFLDEPIADSAILPTYFLSKMTRQQVKVALAGEGGDELFGGYPTYWAHNLASVWMKIPSMVRSRVLEPAIRSLPVSLNYYSLDYKFKKFIEAANLDPLERHFKWMGSFSLHEQAQLLKPHLRLSSCEELIVPSSLISCAGGSGDLVSQIMCVDLLTYLPDGLLVKADRSSMAASLEVRLPFLAFPLVEFALSLPSSLKLRGMNGKYILKKAAAPLLPKSIIERPKKGFGVPIAKWLRTAFKDLLGELLSEKFVLEQDIFEWTYIKRLLEEHETQLFDRRKQLWTLLMFQCWWRKYFGR